MKSFFLAFFIAISFSQVFAQSADPLKIGVVGLTHTHVHWILGREDIGDIEIVAIVEPNRELAQRYSDQHGYSMDIVFDTMEEMFASVEVEAVTAFGTIYEHLEVVQESAPRGVHVMVEKPLTVSLDHAKEMKRLAEEHNIYLLTNYETTWYASNHALKEIVGDNEIGLLRKVVVHDGHKGPAEIGINSEFLEWLIDPVQNGAGALTDFGCYGANLITWLTKGERPISVFALTQTIKPELYPEVDDEATILLEYPTMQGIIQASWNWPISRKDMQVYGKTGVAFADDAETLRFQKNENFDIETVKLPSLPSPFHDPFAYFKAVIRGEIQEQPMSLSSLENNMIVMEILDAAMQSAETGKKVYLDD
ncbi:MAG: Gfo/Idh/MocA family oxidoreductase [Balneolaceae bacterium]|nr:Gfo/Idh/MocA family oxidoreductase [Balneolaceae bacterium]